MAYTTIDDPSAYFQTKLYTGNDSSRAITFDGNTNMQPDWSWFKARSEAYNHAAFDSVRGVQKLIRPNQATAQETHSTTLTAFSSNGFSLGGGDAFTNANNVTYASWHWKKVAGVFDIQTYSGASNTRTISHNLGSVPKAMIFKRLDDGAWIVYHADAGGANKYLVLNTTAAVDTATTLFNNTVPTSSVFSVGNTNSTNGSGIDYVVYLFGNKQGVSKMGSYTGNGSDTPNGVFTWLGFTPAFILIKATDSNSWVIVDNKRPADSNPVDSSLAADSTATETTGDSNTTFDFLSNGFRTNGNSGNNNSSGQKYIYMAFAEQPFVSSSGVPATAR